MESRLGPEKLRNDRFKNALPATSSLSVTSVIFCKMTSEFGCHPLLSIFAFIQSGGNGLKFSMTAWLFVT